MRASSGDTCPPLRAAWPIRGRCGLRRLILCEACDRVFVCGRVFRACGSHRTGVFLASIGAFPRHTYNPGSPKYLSLVPCSYVPT